MTWSRRQEHVGKSDSRFFAYCLEVIAGLHMSPIVAPECNMPKHSMIVGHRNKGLGHVAIWKW